MTSTAWSRAVTVACTVVLAGCTGGFDGPATTRADPVTATTAVAAADTTGRATPSARHDGVTSVDAAAATGTPASATTDDPRRTDTTIDIGHTAIAEDTAVASLWTAILEDRGHLVRRTLLEVGGIYAGLADGSLDVYLDARLPRAHLEYRERNSEALDVIGPWFEDAPMVWAVPEYVDIDSLADLRGEQDLFAGRIYGVDAGSELMQVSRESVIPTYELDGYTLLDGSASDMIAELVTALEAERPIVVTLWRPHWAFAELPIKSLDDPRDAFGEPDDITVVAASSFAERFPDVRAALERFTLTGDAVADLEQAIRAAGRGRQVDAARAWLDDGNRALVDDWFAAADG